MDWIMHELLSFLHMLILIYGFQARDKQFPSGYIGCYEDGNGLIMHDRVLPVKQDDSDLNCASKCKQDCKDSGYRYAGTESGEECFCGNTIQFDPKRLQDSDCNMKCPGKDDENCGGDWRISIYDTSVLENTSTTQNLTTPATSKTEITTDQGTASFTASDSTPDIVTVTNASGNMESDKTHRSFPMAYVFVPAVGLIAIIILVLLLLIIRKRRRKQAIVHDVVYAADSVHDTYENDTETNQVVKNMREKENLEGKSDLDQYENTPTNAANAVEIDTAYNVLSLSSPNIQESGPYYDHIKDDDKPLLNKTYSHLSYNPQDNCQSELTMYSHIENRTAKASSALEDEYETCE